MLKYIKISALLFLSIAMLLFSCERKRRVKPPGEKLLVVCTTGMIADLAKNVGGHKADVYGLMGPGIDPHLYKATPSDISSLFDADIILYNGLHLESKMAELFDKMSKSRITVSVTRRFPESKLHDGGGGFHDPHVWFDVSLWRNAVTEIADAFSKMQPEWAGYYNENARKYLEKLDSLHNFVLRRANELLPEQRILITAHDAFGYFGNAYGFKVVGLQGISTESEAGAKDVSNLVNLIISKKIKAIFIESSVPIKNIKAVQEAVKASGWQVNIGGELFSDSMGDAGSFEGTYIGMVTHNINTIVNALKGNK